MRIRRRPQDTGRRRESELIDYLDRHFRTQGDDGEG